MREGEKKMGTKVTELYKAVLLPSPSTYRTSFNPHH